MHPLILCFVLLLSAGMAAPLNAQEQQGNAPCLHVPEIVLTDVPVTVDIRCDVKEGSAPVLMAGDEPVAVTGYADSQQASIRVSGTQTLTLMNGAAVIAETTITPLPGWLSLIPSVLTIAVALLLRQVIPALFLGIFSGAWIIAGLNFTGFWQGLLNVADRYLLQAVVPPDGDNEHMTIALFTLLAGGMIGVISRSGGMGGVVQHLTRIAHTPRRGQFASFGMGMAVFFDDYANTLIVGNTMRPLMDKLRVSREKLAYIVDSTAAPLACIALVTTWIGFQVSLMEPVIPDMEGYTESAFLLMLYSLPYSFYPVLTLLFIIVMAASGRDFGPMYDAERLARLRRTVPSVSVHEPELDAEDMVTEPDLPEGKAYLAVVPIITLIATVLAGLFITGQGDSIIDIFGSANPFKAMLWGALLSLLVAVVLAVGSGTLSLRSSMNAMERGFTPMLLAVIILTFAWAIANVNGTLHTADYLISLLGDSLNPYWLPAIVFIISALTSFATGASWGTMGILMPLVLPLTWSTMSANELTAPEHWHLLYASVASLLAGAVWGDHCSPISDTTILSSIASGCDHIAHVRTQMPYALTVGGIALLFGIIPASHGVPWWLGMLLGGIAIFLTLRFVGNVVPDPLQAERTQTGARDAP